MNQLTTIAALPAAGGCQAALPAESTKPDEDIIRVDPSMFEFDWDWEHDAATDRLVSLKTPGLVIHGLQLMQMGVAERADILSKTKPLAPPPSVAAAERLGYEPFAYTERS